VQAYQTSQYVVPRDRIFLGKWRSSFAGNSDGNMNVQSACALNTRYMRNRSSVFSDSHLFSMCSISNAWSIVPYVCPVSSICWAYFEFCLIYGLDMFFISDFKYTASLSVKFEWTFIAF
jgi:hypothetical protein